MCFLRSHDTLTLFLHVIMTCMHISKIYNVIRGGRTIQLQENTFKDTYHPLTNLGKKTLDSTDSVDFTHFKCTVNRYCDNG